MASESKVDSPKFRIVQRQRLSPQWLLGFPDPGEYLDADQLREWLARVADDFQARAEENVTDLKEGQFSLLIEVHIVCGKRKTEAETNAPEVPGGGEVRPPRRQRGEKSPAPRDPNDASPVGRGDNDVAGGKGDNPR